MSRYYIDKLNIKFSETPQGWCQDDQKQEFWHHEKNKYGFDEREIWSLHYTMDLLLYERLSMYKEKASKHIDLTSHKFTYKGQELTQLECIDKMLEGLKLNLTLDDLDEKRNDKNIQELIKDVYYLYALCKDTLWL